MTGITPFEVLFMNAVIGVANGLLPALAVVVMGILILRRLPPRGRIGHSPVTGDANSTPHYEAQRGTTPQK